MNDDRNQTAVYKTRILQGAPGLGADHRGKPAPKCVPFVQARTKHSEKHNNMSAMKVARTPQPVQGITPFPPRRCGAVQQRPRAAQRLQAAVEEATAPTSTSGAQ